MLHCTTILAVRGKNPRFVVRDLNGLDEIGRRALHDIMTVADLSQVELQIVLVGWTIISLFCITRDDNLIEYVCALKLKLHEEHVYKLAKDLDLAIVWRHGIAVEVMIIGKKTFHGTCLCTRCYCIDVSSASASILSLKIVAIKTLQTHLMYTD
jgi:hypothetical protein